MKKLTWFALIWAAVYFFLDFFVSSEAAESARSWVMWIVGPIVILIILKDLMEQTIKRCVKEEEEE